MSENEESTYYIGIHIPVSCNNKEARRDISNPQKLEIVLKHVKEISKVS
jgi:hypothetical protein